MLNNTTIYLLPFITAAVAWLLSRIALQMLTRKIIAQRVVIMNGILESLTVNLSASEILKEKLADPAKLAAVKPLIETHVNTFLNSKLQEKLPVIAMFASPDMLAKIKEGLLEEIDLLLPEVIDQYAGSALRGIDPVAMIGRKIAAMPEEQAKEIVAQALGKNSEYVALLAIVFGFLVGSVPVILFLL